MMRGFINDLKELLYVCALALIAFVVIATGLRVILTIGGQG